jgi:sporulation integral membrane protein YtvI
MSISSSIITGFLSFFSSIPYILMVIIFTLIGTYYFTKEMSYIRAKTKSFVNKYEGEKFISILKEGKEMIGNYLWAYCLILLITFIVTLSGFTVLRVKYALTLSAIIAVFDLLPILGAFMVYIPLAIVYLISNNYFTAVGLVVLFLIITVTRQFIEPKIMSKSLDIHPLVMLTALFVGLRFGGVSGILFCTFIVIFYRILHNTEVL